MKKKFFTAVLMQDGLQVARVDAPTIEEAEREIRHYEMMYSEDGPCEIKRKYKNPHTHEFFEVMNGKEIVRGVPSNGKVYLCLGCGEWRKA